MSACRLQVNACSSLNRYVVSAGTLTVMPNVTVCVPAPGPTPAIASMAAPLPPPTTPAVPSLVCVRFHFVCLGLLVSTAVPLGALKGENRPFRLLLPRSLLRGLVLAGVAVVLIRLSPRLSYWRLFVCSFIDL
jgi:hypothetical protein